MNKSIQNPKKILGIIAGVLFVASLLLMFLPGLSVSFKFPGPDIAIIGTASLFVLAFGGDITFSATYEGETAKEVAHTNSNALITVSAVLLIVVIVVTAIIIFGLLSDKLNKKVLIGLCVAAIVLAIVSAILIFASKESSLYRGVEAFLLADESEVTPEIVKKYMQELKNLQGTKIGLGAGGIIAPIVAILGAGTLGGATALFAKEAK